MDKNSYSSLHTHTMYSNIRLKDCINRVEDLIDKGFNLGLNGLVITDHETLSAHIKAKKYIESNREKFGDFKVGFGNEIYLVDRDEIEDKKQNNEKIRFNHFILIAKNKNGYNFLRKQSTQAWKNSFYYRGMDRVPTYLDWLEKEIVPYKGDIIASSACLGGTLPQLILNYDSNKTEDNYYKIIYWLKKMVNIFGKDNFYLEMQPSNFEEQKIVNDYIVKISKVMNLKYIITTDAHYLDLEQKMVHKIYLRSADENRDVDSFYDTTYLMNADEVKNFFNNEVVTSEAFKNTNSILDSLEEIEFYHKPIVPRAHIPEFKKIKLNDYNSNIDWNKYPHILEYEKANNKSDLYYIKLIMDGLISHKEEFSDLQLSRIDTELDVVKAIGDNFGTPMSGYFLAQKEFIDINSEISLVGPARGSAACFYTNYLIDIVQINPLKYDLPYWRFLNKDRLDNMPDIDTDFEGAKRGNIITKVKEEFGDDKVLNIGTFSTEGVRSSILSACRGIGMDNNESNNLLDLLPTEKGINWPVEDAFYGNTEKNRKPAKKFIEEVEKHKNLKKVILGIQGLVSGRSQHASGVVVMSDGYDKYFGMMKTSAGLPITQVDAHDVEYTGGIKFDFLSINAADRIREAMRLLLKDNIIKWQGGLKKTYNKYFHPDVIDIKNKEMYQQIIDGKVPHIFQFESGQGFKGLKHVKPKNFDELAATNSLIRLTTEGKQPIDKYVEFKNNPNLWFEEMENNGLNKEEQEILNNILSPRYGICDTQEYLMMISMDKNISNFSLKQANKLRKSVAKKDPVLQQQEKDIFFDKCKENNTSDNLANYVWNFCIVPQFGYAFSLPHIVAYTSVAEIEMNISYYYGDIYWKTACLSVDAGVFGNQFTNTSYEKIAAAIVKTKDIIELPNINKSDIGFVPNNNKILFGLGSIAGIGESDVDKIIELRPFQSFDDFVGKVDFSTKKIITCIKSGMFSFFGKNTKELMIYYIMKYTERKSKLTTVQLPKIIDKVPDNLRPQKLAYKMKTTLFGRNSVDMNENIESAFLKYFSSYDIKYEYIDGVLSVDKKSFDKWFNKFAKDLKDWLKTDEAIEVLARKEMENTWKKECLGNSASWYFETLSYYPNEHELDLTPIKNRFDIDKYSYLPEDGKNNGTKYKNYQKALIVGTVVDKDRKGLIYIITNDNQFVTVRINKGKFAYYNKRVSQGVGKNRHIVDKSWFDRGTKLVVAGFRRGDEFIANSRGTGLKHSLLKVDGFNKNIEIRSEKMIED